MTIKLIAFDMDGTLLTSENKILPETKALIIQLQQQGVCVVLASGRSYTRLLPYAEELRMKEFQGHLIEINGGARYDVSRQKRDVISQITIAQAHELFDYFSQWKVEIIAQMDEGMYDYNPPEIWEEKKRWRNERCLDDDYPWTGGSYDFISDTRNGYPNIHYINSKEEIITTINKMSITYWKDTMHEVRKQAKKDLTPRYWLGMASEKWLEVMPCEVTKASGLRLLGESLGIQPAEMMAFGDGENDIDMLQYVRLGIAMGNGLDSVKKAAFDVTDTNNAGGIEKALRKYVFNV